jgi:hypothetical protein
MIMTMWMTFIDNGQLPQWCIKTPRLKAKQYLIPYRQAEYATHRPLNVSPLTPHRVSFIDVTSGGAKLRDLDVQERRAFWAL